MFFLEAVKTVVDLAEFKADRESHRKAVSIVKKWLASDAPRKIQVEQKEPLTVIFHPNGYIQFCGVAASEIVIDDRRD